MMYVKKVKALLSCFLTLLLVCTMTMSLPVTTWAAQQDIVILYTNDVHCGVDDHLGYASLSLYKKQMLSQTPYVTLVDAGDAIQGAPIGTLSEGAYLIDIMNQVGYDFAVPGNHEFDYGMDRFLSLANQLQAGYYSCNFLSLDTKTPVFAPYKKISYGDTDVAFVGISTPESFTKSTPAYFQDQQGNDLYSFCEDETGAALYEQVQKTVSQARLEGADYVIAVGHLGENGVTEKWSSDQVIANTTGIDAFIDGHSHETIPSRQVTNKQGEDVLLTQTGTKLNQFGQLTIRPDGSLTSTLISQVEDQAVTDTYTVMPKDSLSRIAKRQLGSYDRWNEIYASNRDKLSNPNQLTPGLLLTIPSPNYINDKGQAMDAQTYRFIANIQSQYNQSLKVVLGHSGYLLTSMDPATGERAIRNRETNLGNITADAYRYVLETEIGLSNGGGIRSDIPAGDITYLDTLKVFPYGNMGTAIEATGQQILDALEMGARKYPEESGGFLHVSGLTYTIHTPTPSAVETDNKGNFVKVNGSYRVRDVMVNGQPLDLNRTYSVGSHNYLLQSGGDGMTMFQNCNILKDAVITDVDLLSRYINTYLSGSVGSQYENAYGEGRIQVTDQ